jgi:hypothetical protein
MKAEEIKQMAEDKALEKYPFIKMEHLDTGFPYDANHERRQAYAQAIIDNYEENDAAEFLEWITTMEVDRIGATAGWHVDKLNDGHFSPIMTSKELYELFKKTKL